MIETLNHFFKPAHHLSDEDIRKIAIEVEKVLKGNVAKPKVQEVYRKLERDTAIKGVGASLVPGQRPELIVPRERFLQESGDKIAPDTKPQRRTKTTRERVTLISPVLLLKKRRWKFYLPQLGEFGAGIEHGELASLVQGRHRIPLKQGIQLDVLLDTFEEKQGDVWVVTDRAIQKVIRVRKGSSTPDLFAPETKARKSNNKKKRKP